MNTIEDVLAGRATWSLQLGDCLTGMRALPDGCVHMVWTDPPYGHGNMQDDLQAARVRDGVKGARVRESEPITADAAHEYEPLIDSLMAELSRVLDRDCCCCCCCCAGGGGPSPAFGWLALRMDQRGMEFFHAVVWDKSARGDGMGWRYRRNYEFVMVSKRRGGKLRWNPACKAMPNVVRDIPVRERIHPNEKPVALVRRFLLAHTLPGDIVLDPFVGSGTTGLACLLTGRRFIGYEIDPAYHAIAVKRLSECNEIPPLLAAVSSTLFDGLPEDATP